ncbi:MAG: RNA polymerase sigma factor, partial [Ilumatobacteraceae bacterium]
MAAAQQGDRAALDALLRRHYGRVHAVCRRITGSHADAADAAQEALIAIVRGLPRFDGRSSFGTWAYRVA